MSTLQEISQFLGQLAPLHLAEAWDNVGLLVGRQQRMVASVMTCLTLTPAAVAEAVDRQAQLVVVHHPLPFRPINRITDESTTGRLLLDLAQHDIAVYSSHTAFDSAAHGINQQLAEGLGLQEIQPLIPCDRDAQGLGSGRWGTLPQPVPFVELASRLKKRLGIDHMEAVGVRDRWVHRVAIGCGSAGTLLTAARDTNCDTMILGETNFHTCLEAIALGVNLLLCGHFASERFALEWLAERLAEQFSGLSVWCSEQEADPLWQV